MTTMPENGLHRFVVLLDSKHKGDRPSFILWIGEDFPRYFLVWGSLDDAIEEAASWCDEHAPGRLVPASDVAATYREAFQEALARGLCEEAAEDYAHEAATVDLLVLDCNRYLNCDHWGIHSENPDRGTILELKKELESRYYLLDGS